VGRSTGHTVLSPIAAEARLRHDVGEGQGGGDGRAVVAAADDGGKTADAGSPPTPNPSPRGRGGLGRDSRWAARLKDLRRTGLAAAWCAVALGLLLPTAALAAGGGEVSPFVYQFMVFVIAIFVGYYVVWSVTPALHTPLMSVTNAISSVIVVGALLAVGVSLVAQGSALAKFFGFLALVMASVNIFGGFLVTQRMLAMYKKKETKR
jgi:NAD(P) transhydrogenase subunit alpha